MSGVGDYSAFALDKFAAPDDIEDGLLQKPYILLFIYGYFNDSVILKKRDQALFGGRPGTANRFK